MPYIKDIETEKLIADNMRIKRLEAKLTQEDVAARLNISVTQYRELEKARNQVKSVPLAQFCEIVGCDIGDMYKRGDK